MTRTAPSVEIRKARRGYAIYAGVSLLSRSFKTREQAERWAEDNAKFLACWAGSPSVSVENTQPRVIHA